jgi:hypothetical protein
VVVGGSGALATTVDILAGDAVAADDVDAVNAVVPPSSTKNEDAYVGASVAFKGACIGAFADGATAADRFCGHRGQCLLGPNLALCKALGENERGEDALEASLEAYCRPRKMLKPSKLL